MMTKQDANMTKSLEKTIINVITFGNSLKYGIYTLVSMAKYEMIKFT